jgi:hypothetical protein
MLTLDLLAKRPFPASITCQENQSQLAEAALTI